MINLFNISLKNQSPDYDTDSKLITISKHSHKLHKLFTKNHSSKSYGHLSSKRGFDENGLHKNGTYFDDEGYSIDGFNRDGIDKEGFNRGGYNKLGFNRQGFDIEGFNIHGFDKNGFDRNGFNKDGFDIHGIDKDGYNHSGFDKDGFNKAGIDAHGYNKEGFDIHGFNREGFNREGYDKRGYDKNGFDLNGYDRKGFDRQGFDKQGYNINGEFTEFIVSQLREMYSLYVLNPTNLYKENVKNILLYLKLSKESIKYNNSNDGIEYLRKLAYIFCDELLKEKGIMNTKQMPSEEKLALLSNVIIPNKYLEVLCIFMSENTINISNDTLKKSLQTFSNMVGEWIGKLNISLV